MRFSDYLKIEKPSNAKWFDPILSVDTRLFVGSFLIYANEKGHFTEIKKGC